MVFRKTPKFDIHLSHIENEVYNLTQFLADNEPIPDFKLNVNGITLYYHNVKDIEIVPVRQQNTIYFSVLENLYNEYEIKIPIKIDVKKLKEFEIIDDERWIDGYVSIHS